MVNQQEAYDLSALADRLCKERRKLNLAHLIQSAVDARSIELDLTFALEAYVSLTHSLDNPIKQPRNFRETSDAALLSYIILLYARATKSDSDVRKQYDPRPKFTADEKKVHTEICDLRDKAVAHFGYGGSYEGIWAMELAMLDVSGNWEWPAIVHRRLVVDRALLARAGAQISRALQIIRPICAERMNAFIDAIKAECVADLQFRKEIQQHPFDLAIFLGGEEQAAQIRAGRGAGQARGAFHHK